MNPDCFFLFGKPHFLNSENNNILLGIKDSLEIVMFDSWTTIYEQKDICCVVRASRREFKNNPHHSALYFVEISDHRGIIPEADIPEAESNCSWCGSSYTSIEDALKQALSKFYKSRHLIDKLNKVFSVGVLND